MSKKAESAYYAACGHTLRRAIGHWIRTSVPIPVDIHKIGDDFPLDDDTVAGNMPDVIANAGGCTIHRLTTSSTSGHWALAMNYEEFGTKEKSFKRISHFHWEFEPFITP